MLPRSFLFFASQLELPSPGSPNDAKLKFSCVDYDLFCIIIGVVLYVCDMDDLARKAMHSLNLAAAHKTLQSSKVRIIALVDK